MQEVISKILILLFNVIYWYIVIFLICPWIIEIYFRCTSYRLSDLFISTKSKNRIHQGVSIKGKKLIKEHRRKHKNKSLNLKLYKMAKLVDTQISKALPKLKINTLYTTYTHTHIKKIIENGEQNGYLKIHNIKKGKQRSIFVESFIILGLKDTFSVLFIKKYRQNLKKQFYTITFTRIK